MASPTTSATSTRVGKLHQKERSSSFASLNPFRTKSVRQTSEYIKPYEVAPGIWSTDATAKVFGYRDPIERTPSKRNRSTGPDDRRSLSPTVKHNPGRVRALIGLIKEARRDDETDEFLNHPQRRHVEARERARQQKLYEARRVAEEGRRRKLKGRMRTVSREDELIQRAANPRTGIVSPFITTEDSTRASADDDYVSLGKVRAAKASQNRNTSNGRWRQDSGGWSIVESPSLTPIAKSSSEGRSRQTSVKTLQDRLLAEMPSRDNLTPKKMTNDEVLRYQESIEQAYKHCGGRHAMVHPETLPSPRQLTPEGPSTPPKKLHKIFRKEVGSGPPPPRAQSTDTVIIDARAGLPSKAPSMSHSAKENQQVRIITPSQIDLGISPRTPMDKESTFLGRGPPQFQTASGGPYPPTGRSMACPLSPLSSQGQQCPHEVPSDRPSTFPTLNQYLPRINFPYPNQLSNLEKSTYRRHAQLLPARLRPPESKRQDVEDASIITTTTTSTVQAQKDSRPKLQRQVGVRNVQRLPHQNMTNRGQGRHLIQRTMQRKDDTPGRLKIGMRSPKRDLNNHTPEGPHVRAENTGERGPRIVNGAEVGVWTAMLEDRQIERVREIVQTSRDALAPKRPEVVLKRAPREGNMDGCIRTFDPPGSDTLWNGLDGSSVGSLAEKQQRLFRVDEPDDEGGVCFTGNWTDSPVRGHSASGTVWVAPIPLARRSTLKVKGVEVRQWLEAIERWLHTSVLTALMQRETWPICYHVASILLGASAAIGVLRSPNTKPAAHLKAVRNVVLASVYVLVLANLCMTLGRAFLAILRVVYWICHPFALASSILRWCILD